MAGSVLLIDDDVDVLRSVGKYLEQLGYEVARELTGEAGLSSYERLRPDVVVLDLQLPGMVGMEVLERLSELDALVVLLTGTGDVETAVEAMKAGAENFLTKPVLLDHLAAVTSRVIDKARLRIRMVRPGRPCILAIDNSRLSFRGEEATTVLVEVSHNGHVAGNNPTRRAIETQ